MLERLRKPGGHLGSLSVASAAVLAAVGVVGVLGMILGLATGSDWWSESNSDYWIAMVFFAVTFVGAIGFVLEDRSPWAGAALGVVGGAAMAMVLFWAVVPVVLGLGAAVVAVMRARAFHHGSTAAHPA